MIYIITAVHNRYDITEAFVNRLLAQTYEEIQLVLVDDGSTDGTAEMVKSLMPNAIILQGDGNLWWGGSLHRAYTWVKQNAKKDAYVMFANDDTQFEDDYIKRAIHILSGMKKTLLTGYGISKQTGSQIDGAVDFVFPKVAGYVQKNKKQADGNCASTRNLFFRVEDFLKIGGFHPLLLPHYGSDYEWTIRANRKYNYRIYCTKDLIYEANEETTGYHSPKEQSLKMLLSKRSSSNPFYKVSFALLAAPWGKKIYSVYVQGKRMIGNLE